LELAREQQLEFTVQELPVLDLDFLLPSPLASPDFSDRLLAQPSIPEPDWVELSIPQEPQEAETVRVERGDTLWKIAERHLGDGRDWRKIATANPELKDPNLIQAGKLLRLPGVEASSSTEKTVRVQAGDSLWKVAASQLGAGNAWRCLVTANPQIEDANRIYPGQVLTIPTNCSRG
jgi:nucleoid-associated protein YgaU